MRQAGVRTYSLIGRRAPPKGSQLAGVRYCFAFRQRLIVRCKEQYPQTIMDDPTTGKLIEQPLLARAIVARIAAGCHLGQRVIGHTGLSGWDSGQPNLLQDKHHRAQSAYLTFARHEQTSP